MNRAQKIAEIVRLEGIAAAAAGLAKQLRGEIDAEARAELAEQGAAPRWTIPGVGTVYLPLTKPAVTVTDPKAWTAWVRAEHPSEVETVERVRPASETALLGRLLTEGDVAVDRETGTIVPGLRVRPGGEPGALTLRIDSDARKAAITEAGHVLTALAEPIGHLAPSEVPGA
ncbi:hypothetical protein ACIA8K_06885 [Catenuloplanes sp. NPDC051500]|uniref:hypothetical protein n=1 Tax=Catenuloplanes sp. NPDC051500 TaxID=3363959 RepID=UPI00379BD7C3